MSMNTPTGGITQITPIKNFQEISELDNEQYLLGIKDYSTGSGGKVKFETLISDSISENNDNIITTGTDGKLLVNTPPQIGNLSNLTTTNKSTLVGAINEVDGDVGNLANLTTSVKTNVVNAINSEVSARNTAETNIQNDYNGKIGTLSNLDTTDKSNIVGAINELAAVAEPSLQYETMNNSKALETGAPSENAIILADVQKYAHSSFDRSKFTVVGSPIITDDGIASGFSSSNYLTKLSIATISNNGEFHIDFKFNDAQYTSNQYILDLYNTASNELFIRRNPNGDNYQCLIFVSGTIVFNKTITDSSNDISGYIEYKNGVYTLDINGVKETLTSTSKMTATTYNLSLGVRLSSGAGDSPLINGSIDLKQFSVTVDGVPVFSGNKTGLSVIKLDAFTTVGSPSITFDGIASGFTSSTNYITGSFTSVSATNKVELWTAITNNSADTNGSVYCATNGNLRITKASVNEIGIRGLSGGLTVNSPNLNLQNGDFVIAHAIVTTTNATLQTWVNGVKQTDVTVSGDFSAIATSYDSLYIGGQYSNGNYSPASAIDINYCKVLIDGNLDYQPCLKIPYTESFTGSKIVDAIYRDRVVDAYEQGYSQRYYTIQEDKKGNYAVVGSPTISGDFVASGFSSSNYISAPINYTTGQSLEITLSAKFPAIPGSGYEVICGKWTTGSYFFELRYDSSGALYFVYKDSSITTKVLSCGTFNENDTLNAVINFANGTTVVTTDQNYTVNDAVFPTYSGNLNISSSTNPFLGSIDLKQFSVTVDNKVVYKAVSDPNFTLPMGEIYGDIEYNRANKLDLTTANATQETVSKINGWCIPDYANGVGKVVNTVYQAAKNVYVKIVNNTDGGAAGYIYIGTTNNPVTEIAQWGGNVATANTVYYMIPKGYYYKVYGTGISSITEIPFMGE